MESQDAADVSLLLEQQIRARVLEILLSILQPYQQIRNSDIAKSLDSGSPWVAQNGLAEAILNALDQTDAFKSAVRRAVRESL